MTEIHVEDLLPTFSDLEARLKIYKETKSVDFYVSNSRTMESARMRCRNIVERMPEALKYYYNKFKCVKGGTLKAKKTSKGMRETS